METIFFIIIFALQCVDVYTTHKTLDQGGIEKNPVIKKLMQIMGVLPALVVSKVAVLALVALDWYIDAYPIPVMLIITIAYAGVAINKLHVLRECSGGR